MTDMEEFSTPSYPSGDITLLTVEIVRNRAAIRELLAALQLAEETLCSLESDLREFGVDDCGAELAILTARAAIAKHDTSTTATTKETV